MPAFLLPPPASLGYTAPTLPIIREELAVLQVIREELAVWQERRRFHAQDPAGQVVTIVLQVAGNSAPRTVNRSEEVEAIRRYVTTAGEIVYRLDKGSYRLRDSGIDLRSDDPAAL
jgi:hypothetical protein